LKNVSILVFLIYLMMAHSAAIQDWINRRSGEIKKAVEHGVTFRLEACWNPTATKMKSESKNGKQ